MNNETPKQAARRLSAHIIGKGYQPEALHGYTDADGNAIYWRIRARNPATGEKWIRPMRLSASQYELGEPDFPNGKPLYAMPRLADNPASTIEIVEGEKCADKLNALGLVATTSGGATSAGTVNAEILRGRTIRIWPDHDHAGQKFATDWAAILTKLGCAFTVIDASALGLADGGDCVDWFAAHPEADGGAIESLQVAVSNDTGNNSAPAPVSRERIVKLTSAADIQPKPIHWLWKDWLASGKFHILGGAPGTGKTTLAIAFAATVSTGGRWPDGTRAETGNVLIWSGEDDPDTTLVPRLIAAGADVARVSFVTGTVGPDGHLPFDPSQDMPRLTEAAARMGNVRLLIVDPVVSAVAGNSHNNAETRRALQPLVDLGATLNCAVLGITHFTKGTGGSDPVERITGSIAFAALARVVLVAAKQRTPAEGESSRMLARSKSNIGLDEGGFSYDLEQIELPTHPGNFASYVVWGPPLEGTAREMLATADMGDDEEGGALAEAKEFLNDLLKYGQVATAEIQAAAKKAGLSWSTVRRAKNSLGIQTEKAGMKGGWAWTMPRRCSSNPEDAHTQGMSTFANSEHLRQFRAAPDEQSEVF